MDAEFLRTTGRWADPPVATIRQTRFRANGPSMSVFHRCLWVIVIAAAVLVVGCPSAAPPSAKDAPRMIFLEDLERGNRPGRRLFPCHMIIESMRAQAGQGAISCSEGRTNLEAIACTNDAFRRKQAFLLCDSGLGMDSYFENGVVGLSNGNIVIYYLDTLGPAYRGTCLSPNISLATDDWPQCRTSLVDEVDLRTGKPYVERPKLSVEEDWPMSCAQDALRAPRWPVGVQLVSGKNPLPQPERWGLTCGDAAVSFEMLIDRTGKVKCSRIISVGLRAPRPGLYDSIRSYLNRWRFKPPTLHGEPIDVRWGMTIFPIRADDTKIPRPQIYPICQ